jgi:2-polyprenyl-3-methyl-5-hydroxy-6-metoxy-1,4-benzoquinol methylase
MPRKGLSTEIQIATPADLTKLVNAFRPSRIILTAFELGVFTALSGKRGPSSVAAKILRVDPRGLDRLMNALCVLGLLEKRGGVFSNSPFAARCLVKGNPEFMGGLAHSANLWNSWSTLTRAVARGGTVLKKRGRSGSGRARVRGFIAAMHQRASLQAAETAHLIDLSGVKRILDVGGGSGAYAMAMLRAADGARATVFDLPDVIPLTRAHVKREGLTKRFDYTAGDFHTDDFGRGYDLILLSAIIHMNSVSENKRLFRKCAGALNAGGRLVVQDYIMNDRRTLPATGAFFALNMLVGTQSGDTYTEREVRGWLRAAGFLRIRRIDTPFDSALMIANKKRAYA